MDSGLLLEQHASRMRVPNVEAPEDAINARLLARRARDKALIDILGAPLYAATTMLPRTNGLSTLGPAFYDGHALKWSLWSPHRNALLDIFKTRLPHEDEIKARMEFAEKHHIKYAVVRPGWKVTVDHLRRWLG